MDNEAPHQELVKCVVVGDTAVGKTRLICARAYNKQFSLSQLLNTHVPTVWAIDQYRIYKEVLERSYLSVDGVNVSLRLWDTFGDHDKDRRFAYGRSDVVVLCFSVANPVSLRNCLVMWYPEIRKFCPNTPILLVGCKNDLRYICKDEEYLKYCRDRSPLVRTTRETDIVMPGEGRALARELGIEYYETSVLSFYGVNELFDNVIRSALIARRQHRFWMTNLKKVQRPIPQVPFCPPKPKLPQPSVMPSTIVEDFHNMYQTGAFSDLVLVSGNTLVFAHRFIAAAASLAFHKLFLELAAPWQTRRDSDGSMVSGSFDDAAMGNFNSDTECLLRDVNVREHRLHYGSFQRNLDYLVPAASDALFYKELKHPAFKSVSLEEWGDVGEQQSQLNRRHKAKSVVPLQTVVTMSKFVSGHALSQLVHFMYTGSLHCRTCPLSPPDLGKLREIAEFLEIPELEIFTTNCMRKCEPLSTTSDEDYIQILRVRLSEVCTESSLFSDVLLQMDDGATSAHRALLMSRCDVMRAMFSGDFREGNAKVVSFPGVKLRTFQVILQYLYTDTVPNLTIRECVAIVELANRLCLPRLICLVEQEIIDLFNRVLQAGGNVSEDCLYFLEPLQMHNADQLVDWCLTYLATNYNHICYKHSKFLRSLHPENQAWLNRHRWPPVWYLKDFDFYERCIIERQREDNPRKPLKRTRNPSGCLCFSSRKAQKAPKQSYRTILYKTSMWYYCFPWVAEFV